MGRVFVPNGDEGRLKAIQWLDGVIDIIRSAEQIGSINLDVETPRGFSKSKNRFYFPSINIAAKKSVGNKFLCSFAERQGKKPNEIEYHKMSDGTFSLIHPSIKGMFAMVREAPLSINIGCLTDNALQEVRGREYIDCLRTCSAHKPEKWLSKGYASIMLPIPLLAGKENEIYLSEHTLMETEFWSRKDGVSIKSPIDSLTPFSMKYSW